MQFCLTFRVIDAFQAGMRGMIARKQVASMKEAAPSKEGDITEEKKEEEEIDIDLEDPETEKAALKIQAGFHGMMARKQVKEMKEKHTEETSEEVVVMSNIHTFIS